MVLRDIRKIVQLKIKKTIQVPRGYDARIWGYVLARRHAVISMIFLFSTIFVRKLNEIFFVQSFKLKIFRYVGHFKNNKRHGSGNMTWVQGRWLS